MVRKNSFGFFLAFALACTAVTPAKAGRWFDVFKDIFKDFRSEFVKEASKGTINQLKNDTGSSSTDPNSSGVVEQIKKIADPLLPKPEYLTPEAIIIEKIRSKTTWYGDLYELAEGATVGLLRHVRDTVQQAGCYMVMHPNIVTGALVTVGSIYAGYCAYRYVSGWFSKTTKIKEEIITTTETNE